MRKVYAALPCAGVSQPYGRSGVVTGRFIRLYNARHVIVRDIV
jgi:hypothetical protein